MRINSFIVATIVIMFTSCGDSIPESTKTDETIPDKVMLTADQLNNAGIQYGSVQPTLLSLDVDARGEILIPPDAMADVVSLVGGVIKEIPVQPGDQVKKGEIITRISSPEFLALQQDFLTAFHRKNLLESDFERQQTLNEGKAASEKRLQEAEAAFNNAVAEYTAAREKLKILGIDPSEIKSDNLNAILDIRSPVTGIVDDVYVNLGKYVEPPDIISRILYNNQLLLEILVFEKDIDKVKKGQRITFRIGNQIKEHESNVTGISASVKGEARVVKVLADFQNDELDLLPGMFISARIHTSEEMLDALPEEAVIFDGKHRYFIYYTIPEWQNDSSVFFQDATVHVGFSEDGYTQVDLLEPLPDGSKIVVKGAYYINSEKMKGEE